jgi:MSHA biogenesis protein MshO
MMRSLPSRAQRGFTLVEAIVVIVVLGVLATVVALFIRAPMQGYADAVGRAEVTDAADLALRRMARDLRLALPNSIRVSGDHFALEFMLTRTGGRYLASEDGIDNAEVLDFSNPDKLSFTALSGLGSFGRAVIGDYLVVYNLGPGMQPADAYQYCPPTGCADGAAPNNNVARITAVNQQLIPALDPVNTFPVLTLERNPFAAQSVPLSTPVQAVQLQSPMQRFQVVSGPVSYYCAAQPDGTLALWRAWGYPVSGNQNVPPAGGKRALVATRLARCDVFDYSTAASQRSGLVILGLELRARNERDPAIRLVHQVHVDNTP